jgi:hypothetical protein
MVEAARAVIRGAARRSTPQGIDKQMLTAIAMSSTSYL